MEKLASLSLTGCLEAKAELNEELEAGRRRQIEQITVWNSKTSTLVSPLRWCRVRSGSGNGPAERRKIRHLR